MKYLIVFNVLLISQVIFANAEETFCEEELKCIEKLHLDKTHIENVIRDETNKFLPENDIDFNSFQFCHWNARELQDINGNLNYDKIVDCVQDFPRSEYGGKTDEVIGSKIALEATESCKNLPKRENHGQAAVQVQNCIDKRMMELLQQEA